MLNANIVTLLVIAIGMHLCLSYIFLLTCNLFDGLKKTTESILGFVIIIDY
jgi:hypothetical protein